MEIERQVTLRPETSEDDEFCFQVYASTRIEEFAHVGWSAEDFERVMRQQFAAYTMHYRARYPDGDYSIILLDENPVGRLIVVRPGSEIYLADGALLPEYRGQGIMSYLMLNVVEEANAKNLPVRLMVDKNNRAINMYYRLGFVLTSSIETHHLLERPAAATLGNPDSTQTMPDKNAPPLSAQ